MKYQPVIGLEVHVQLLTNTKIFCGCSDHVRRRAQLPDLPGLPRPAGGAAGAQQEGGGVRHPGRPRHQLLHLAPVASLPGRTTSIPTSPRGTRSASTNSPSAWAGIWTSRWTARAKRIGITRIHMEEDAGKLVHADVPGLGERLRRGPEPGLHAASGDRLRAGPPHRRRGSGLSEEAPPDRGLPGDQRRQHGGGELPLRRQRLGDAGRLGQIRHPRRDQERQLLPLRQAGHRVRDRAPDRAHRGGREGGAGDPPLRPGQRHDPLHARQGGGPRLPLLPRPGPGAAGHLRRLGGGYPARAPRTPRGEAGTLHR